MVGKVAIYVVMVIFSAVVVFPLVAMVFGSFKTQFEFFSNPWGLPSELNWSNYAFAWQQAQIPRFIGNSVFVAAATVALTLVLASCAAYGFSTFKFRGSRALFLMFVLLLIVPVPVGIIPLYVIIVRLHLLIPTCAHPALHGGELAAVDFSAASLLPVDPAGTYGCRSHRRVHAVYRHSCASSCPFRAQGLATVTLLSFLNSWNEFFLALIFIHNPNLMTLPLGLQVFYTQYSTQWNYLFAALTMGIIPIIVVYLALQRQFIAGLTAGAVRG